MPVTAIRVPTKLESKHFVGQARIVDPHDGSEQLASTDFHVDLPSVTTRTVGGRKALPDSFQIKITPRAKVKFGTTLTPALLQHEQFHFDLGFVIARRVALILAELRADTVAELDAKFKDLIKLHFETRNRLLHRRYDTDTKHGTQAHYQKIWSDRMQSCLADSSAKQLGGYYL